MEINQLQGKKSFSGIEYGMQDWDNGYGKETVQCIYFIFDGVTYFASENPEDGYRSCCNDILISEKVIKNTFENVNVFCIYNGGDSSDIIRVYDEVTAKLIFELGTENVDDYYPCFLFNYYPGNMSINQ